MAIRTNCMTPEKRLLIDGLRKKGMQIADDFNCAGMPEFGSEPFLISIAEEVTIASRVVFLTHDGGTWVIHGLGQDKYNDIIKYGRITIYRNVCIGYGTTIMPGVSIGPNSVVAAGSVVTKDVAPNSVYGGVPAKFIMTLEDYAEKCLAQVPPYDKVAYKTDKTAELLRLFPRPW
jgi:acetyltransferase-like isoleucine patch superfamily enzyme